MKKLSLQVMYVAAMIVFSASSSIAQGGSRPSPDEHLKFVLVLTRHGVRSPTWTNSRLEEYSKEPWPKWEVAPGLLTAHGKTLMNIFGAYYRTNFSTRGLLSQKGCSDAKHVYFYADTDERTVQTAHGLAEGMLPGCPIEVHSLAEGTQDTLFHASGKLGKPDAQLAFSAVAGRMGFDPAALLPAYRQQLEEMQEILFACKEVDCKVDGKKSPLELASGLAPGKGEHLVDIKGPLPTAATLAENFQLEYLEGMPSAQVGWGRLDTQKMLALMSLHAASSDIVQRTPYIARIQASNLLTHMLRTLEQAELQKPVSGAIGEPGDKVVFLVGHDTNIANVAALLDVHWLVNGYQRDDAAPGGALVFELSSADGKSDVVRIYYTVQRPEQMRESLSLSPANPPGKAVVFVPRCSHAGDGAPCEWNAFQDLIPMVIDGAFVQ